MFSPYVSRPHTSVPSALLAAEKAARLQHLRRLGHEPVPTRPENPKALVTSRKRLNDKDFAGDVGIAVRTGLRLDGTYLCRIDLDGHRPDQDPAAAYEAIAATLGPLLDKCAVKRSTSGTGIDVLFLAERELPNNQPLYINGVHVGELFCVGGHVGVPESWLRGSLETLELLEPEELEQLLKVVSLQQGTGKPASWTARSREGLPLIRGWQQVDRGHFIGAEGMPKTFVGDKPKHKIARANWRRLMEAKPGERSDAYAGFVQSTMLLATETYGSTPEEKCRTVAAIAIPVCLKASDGDYDVVKDTAAIIAKVLHGDAYTNGRGHFKIPSWAQEYRPVTRTAKCRPTGDRDKALGRLRRLLNCHTTGMRVEEIGGQKLTIDLLARKLGVEPRSVQRYLAALEANGEIIRDKVDGRGGRLVITLLPNFGNKG